MKASKKLQKQFADFKAEFANMCRQFGGVENPKWPSEFIIKTPWGTVEASIHEPWGMDMQVYAGERHRSSTGIYLRASDYKELPDYWRDPYDGRQHWKWNIHRSMDAGGMYAEVCREALNEFRRRLALATTESGVQS
jgi:hypothetical protein